MKSLLIGFLRGLGFVVLTAVLTYVGDASHLQGILSPSISSLIAMFALGIEKMIEDNTGRALFGAVRS